MTDLTRLISDTKRLLSQINKNITCNADTLVELQTLDFYLAKLITRCLSLSIPDKVSAIKQEASCHDNDTLRLVLDTRQFEDAFYDSDDEVPVSRSRRQPDSKWNPSATRKLISGRANMTNREVSNKAGIRDDVIRERRSRNKQMKAVQASKAGSEESDNDSWSISESAASSSDDSDVPLSRYRKRATVLEADDATADPNPGTADNVKILDKYQPFLYTPEYKRNLLNSCSHLTSRQASELTNVGSSTIRRWRRESNAREQTAHEESAQEEKPQESKTEQSELKLPEHTRLHLYTPEYKENLLNTCSHLTSRKASELTKVNSSTIRRWRRERDAREQTTREESPREQKPQELDMEQSELKTPEPAQELVRSDVISSYRPVEEEGPLKSAEDRGDYYFLPDINNPAVPLEFDHGVNISDKIPDDCVIPTSGASSPNLVTPVALSAGEGEITPTSPSRSFATLQNVPPASFSPPRNQPPSSEIQVDLTLVMESILSSPATSSPFLVSAVPDDVVAATELPDNSLLNLFNNNPTTPAINESKIKEQAIGENRPSKSQGRKTSKPKQKVKSLKVASLPDLHCDQCDFKSKHPYNLSRHKKTHTSEMPFVCDLCGFLSNRQDTLRVHMRVHVKSELFCCEKCDHKSGSLHEVMKHVKSSHAKAAPDADK